MHESKRSDADECEVMLKIPTPAKEVDGVTGDVLRKNPADSAWRGVGQAEPDFHREVLDPSLGFLGMPAWVRPVPMLPYENLIGSAVAYGAFAILLHLDDVSAPDDGDVAEVLHLGVGKFQPQKVSTPGVKLRGGLQDVRSPLPLCLAPAHHDSFGRHQPLNRLRVSGKPGSPHLFPNAQQCVIVLLGP